MTRLVTALLGCLDRGAQNLIVSGLSSVPIAALLLLGLAVSCGGVPRDKDTTSVQVSYSGDTNDNLGPAQSRPISPTPATPPPTLENEPAAPKPASAKAAAKDEHGQVRVVLGGLRNTRGVARLALFTSKHGFPDKHRRAFAKANARIRGTTAIAVFKKVPPGKFAIVVLHDEDGNGKMKKNFVGIPKEGFGISRNPRIRMSEPSFGEAALRLAPRQKARVAIRMKYM